MIHFSDGELQAYLDGEFNPDDGREMERHLQSCPECMAALNQLDIAGRVTTCALTQLDTLPEVEASPDGVEERARAIRHRAAARRSRRARKRRLLAASVILAIGAGAALPASPLRAWLIRAWEQVVLVFGPEEQPAQPSEPDTASVPPAGSVPPPFPEPGPEEASAPPEEAGLHADASTLPVQILLQELLPGTEIQVVFVDGTQAGVFASLNSRFRSGPGRLVAVVRGERVRVEVPRVAGHILLLADGQRLLEKSGDSLSVPGPVQGRDANGILFVIPDG